MAHKTGYSRSSVAKAEAGRQLLTREFWATADELLHAEGALRAGYERVRAAKEEHRARRREAELAEAYAEAQAHARALRASETPAPPDNDGDGLVVPTEQEVVTRLAAAVGAELAGGLAGPLLYLAILSTPAQRVPGEWKDQFSELLRTFLRGWANTVWRRDYLRLLGWAAATVAASAVSRLDSDEQERLVKAVAAPDRVDDRVIDHIESILAHCKQQEDALGPHAVLHTVLAQRELVGSFLEECPTELRPRLLSVYSDMSTSIGYYFFELDDPASAMHYCDQGRDAAQQAHNTELAVYALGHMSYFSSWHGKAHAGLDFAAAAQSLVGKANDVLLQVYTAERAAEAYAVDGQHKECMAEFDRASAGLVLPVGQRSAESPVYWVDEGFVALKQSDCLLRLGKPAEAVTAAERGLSLIDRSYVSSVARCTLRLGTARSMCGEVEEATRLIGEGALLSIQYRSAQLTGEVKAVCGRLKPWRDTPAVQELDERLMAYGIMPSAE